MARITTFMAYDVKNVERDSLGHLKGHPLPLQATLSNSRGQTMALAHQMGHKEIVVGSAITVHEWKY